MRQTLLGAAFVTSLSRWYIRRLLGNSPPFHPCLSAERRPRIVLCGICYPTTYSPEIKAQQAIFDLPPVYPELFALVGSRVPELRGRNVSYSGTTTPGQVAADNKGWFRVMWNTWGTGNDDDFAYVFDLSTPIGGGTPSHQGNNVYKYHDHKSGESGHDVTVLWFPVGGTGTETMEVRYLMRALP